MPALATPAGKVVLLGAGSGRTFYVDATLGSDANDGRSSDRPWQTIAKVNATPLRQLDRVLFKRGEVWSGTTLVAAYSGGFGRPITYAAYGVGARPVIDGNANTVNATSGASSAYLIWDGIHARAGQEFGFYFAGGAHHVVMTDCEASSNGNDGFIFIDACRDIYLYGCISHDQFDATGTHAQVSGFEIADNCHDITLERCDGYSNVGAGATCHSHVAGGGTPYNITYLNCTFYANSEYGVNLLKGIAGAESDRNVRFIGCTIRDNTTRTGDRTLYGFGVYATTSVADLFPGVSFQGCTISGNEGYALQLQGKNFTFTRCLVIGDWRGVWAQKCLNLRFLNCTLHAPATATQGPFHVSDAATNGVTVENCILSNLIVGDAVMWVAAGATTGFVADYNLYFPTGATAANNRWIWNGAAAAPFATWKTNSGQDAHSLVGNPLYVGSGSYLLQAGSPAINAGTPIAGVTDGYLGAAPDIGYAEAA